MDIIIIYNTGNTRSIDYYISDESDTELDSCVSLVLSLCIIVFCAVICYIMLIMKPLVIKFQSD